MYAQGKPIRIVKKHRSRKTSIEKDQTELKSEIWNAVMSGDLETVERLVNEGADVDTTKDGTTLLVLAIQENQTEMAKKLLELGADISIRHEEITEGVIQFKTAKDYASEEGLVELCELLQNKVILNTNIRTAVQDGNQFLVQSLLKQGGDVNVTTEDGYSLLMVAIRNKDLDLSLLLLQENADVGYVLEVWEQTQTLEEWNTTRYTAKDYAIEHLPTVVDVLDVRMEEDRTKGLSVPDNMNKTPFDDLMQFKKKHVRQKSHVCLII
ncbi:ankyrin repeat domain-containing protein 22-like [Antedon mediterranea]|uniref:ankyrin repeat domain-containing protein 22-like n=1 Tax=Antedon mediterranea TaxID=105859 RepID=UPI003AF64E06